jgi:hypothetical protein
MEYIESYKNIYKGKTCAIIGGGTSCPYDVYDLPEVNVFIGVNQHGAILQPEFTVFTDSHLWRDIRDYKTKFICKEASIQTNTNIEDRTIILCRETPKHRYSGTTAIKVADLMGFDKIYVCGIDQYDSSSEENERYWWWETTQMALKRAKDRRDHNTPEDLRKFISMLRNPQNIYFMSGRMKELHQ